MNLEELREFLKNGHIFVGNTQEERVAGVRFLHDLDFCDVGSWYYERFDECGNFNGTSIPWSFAHISGGELHMYSGVNIRPDTPVMSIEDVKTELAETEEPQDVSVDFSVLYDWIGG